jgi:AraC-like DNA-binding protein
MSSGENDPGCLDHARTRSIRDRRARVPTSARPGWHGEWYAVPTVTSATISVLTLQPLLRVLEGHGVASAPILRSLGIDAAAFERSAARLPASTAWALWRAAVRHSGIEELGLRVAESAVPNSFDLLGYLGVTSATVGDAVRCLVRYAPLLVDSLRIAVTRIGRDTWVRFDAPLDVPRAVSDYRVALLIRMSRLVTGKVLVPREVHFGYPAPPLPEPYALAFGAPVHFRRSRDGVVFSTGLLDVPLLGADPRLCAILETHARQVLGQPSHPSEFRDRVSRALLDALESGGMSHESVADQLGMSSRTLRRRLREEGTSHRELLDDLRHDLAMRYLREPGRTISEVASLLGFADARALGKAFKRWTGRTPTTMRGDDPGITPWSSGLHIPSRRRRPHLR